MAFEVISTDQVAQYEFNENDVVTLLEGVSITSASFGLTGNALVGTTLSNINLNLLGTVSSQSTGIDLFTQISSMSNVSILIGATGSVFSSVIGMSLRSSSDVNITNQGSIFADNNGISVSSITNVLTLNNTGSLTSTEQSAIHVFANGGGMLEVINSGIMTGAGVANEEAIIVNCMSDISNAGSIVGVGGLAIRASDGDFVDQLSNTGLIDGQVALGGGNDVVFNSGTIIGSVVLDSGDDVYRASSDGEVSGNVRGGGGDDQLVGARAADYFVGGNGNDKIKGRAGEDTLEGGNGRDIMLGGGGDDEITGGNAGDLMLGGAGSDVFLFTDTGDIGTTGATRDEIRDFEQGSDIINLSGMVGPDFAFLGGGGFTGGAAPELRLVEVAGSTFVQLDYDGDGSQDARMLVRGVVDMTEADFIL